MNFLTKVREERDRADKIHGDFASVHEGIAVIREEYLELEQECFRRDYSAERIEEEAIQLAAMCWKLVSLAEHSEFASKFLHMQERKENETGR